MEQLLKYRITAFNNETHVITVAFKIDGFFREVEIGLPVINGLYPEGDVLDDLIRSYAPEPVKPEDEKPDAPANSSYIEGLVNEVTKLRLSTQLARRRALEKRSFLLSCSDWTQLPDAQSSIDEEDKIRWREYRQALRDITQQKGWPSYIVWPKIPSMFTVTIYE